MTATREQFGASAYVDHVFNVNSFLSRESDLSPRNPKVSAMLHRFVRDTMRPRGAEEVATILATPRIQAIAPSLRRLLGRAEYEMECFCAAAMIGTDRRGAEERFSSYGNFIYRGNYEALVAAELHAMKCHIKAPPIKADRESVAFVGAGPLPISAIMFHRRTGLPVTCIDSDERACNLGRQLILHLAENERGYEGLERYIHFVHKAGQDHDYATHPIVFIASLIDPKDPIVTRIVKTSHTVATTIIRSAEGLSTLLYKPEDCVAGQEEYNVYLTGQTRPSPQAINTSLVYRFPPGKCWMRNKIELEDQPDRLDVLRPTPVRLWRTRPQDISI
jgi:hypothetical protein